MFLVPCFLTFTTSFSGTDVITAVGNQPKVFCYTDNSDAQRGVQEYGTKKVHLVMLSRNVLPEICPRGSLEVIF